MHDRQYDAVDLRMRKYEADTAKQSKQSSARSN